MRRPYHRVPSRRTQEGSTARNRRSRGAWRRDGATYATYPVTGGDSDHTTRSGIMVISERFKQTRMESSTVGLGDEYESPTSRTRSA